MKRLIDLVMGTVLALLSLPVVLLLAAVSALNLRAWPFFVQTRIGAGGVPFRLVKLRTLPVSTNHYADKRAIESIPLTWVSRTLRRTHLDELPQLVLVPIGRMSLVGPRPEMRFLHEEMPASFARRRTEVRPGCTGLWQIGHQCSGLIAEAPEYDLHYVDNRSLLLDLWIVWRTVTMTIHHRTVSIADIPAWIPQAGTVTALRLGQAHPELEIDPAA
ncbi:MAG: Undecaprenyl-phosphate galactosephosphotransferase [uncultured Acidimicrobiales bacterium]|uniref:Undecaprenyl-phosphate galactosephosphotransferase n=1 Tax=uncultured Acidimicrobiales bacterium TaxID=310071 RepID=A0A6J4HT89_9ACTN|nr:MAG: Undecaprenyl-phosphate galactosephosphotransferase [uncultured Acidimicrobiales bacterium]